MALSQAQLQQYLEEGYVLVESLIPPEDLEPLIGEFEAAIEEKARQLQAQGRLRELHEGAPFDRRLALLCADADAEGAAELWRLGQGKHQKTAGMFAVWTHPAVLEVVEQVIGPEILAHPQFNSRAKLPHQEATVVPWHQDLALLDREADETFMVNFWIPLVDAPLESGALQVIPGSHRWPVLPHRHLGSYDGLADEQLPEGQPVVDCPVGKGGALLIQSRTVHRSLPNTSERVRWSLDLRYCDWRKPTGRASVPGFVVRSRLHPDRVARDWRDWARLFA